MKIRRLTMATMMLIVAVFGILLSGLRGFLDKSGASLPSIGDSKLYEKARMSRNMALWLGSDTLSVAGVVRNSPDGSLKFEDGRGLPLKSPKFKADPNMKAKASWLDMAEVALSLPSSEMEVIELRVFDHASRKLLTNLGGRRYGYRMSSPLTVQLLGMGDALPPSVDVWFRASHHEQGERVVRLKPEAGASARFAEGTVSITEVHQGAANYTRVDVPGEKSPQFRWRQSELDPTRSCSIVVHWEGNWIDGQYEIFAVGTRGERVFAELPHFVDFKAANSTEVIAFNLGVSRIDHFELRPFGGRHTFFFDNVWLPSVKPRLFGPPPSVSIAVDGKDVETEFPELDPIRVILRTRRGDVFGPVTSGGVVFKPIQPEEAASKLSVSLEVQGVSARQAWNIAYTDRDGKPFKSGSLSSGVSLLSGITGGGQIGKWIYGVPLERLGKVTISPP
ncbi:hypothetical protein [Singulisphaera sp. PoT]|uniref:hypothetical protein n=1 Tax=Singulisphaera sp. PoT TaxID=3411797 RepID=UPI003BF5D8D3